MKSPIATSVAIGVGWLVLLGYFLPLGFFEALRVLFLTWAVVLAGVALLVGMINLSGHHWERVRKRQAGRANSMWLVASLWVTFSLVLYFSPASKQVQALFNYFLLPASIGLMALLAFTLAAAAITLLRRRSGVFAALFLGTLVLILLGAISLPGLGAIPVLSDVVRPWLAQVPAAAGARGILLGVALGIVATGLRILIGSDRPYGE